MAGASSTTQHRHHHHKHRSKFKRHLLRNSVLLATLVVVVLAGVGLHYVRQWNVVRKEVSTEQFAVRVVKIIDGDTFMGLREKGDTLVCHIYCIEAPEIEQPQGFEARKCLHQAIFQQRVDISPKGYLAADELRAVVVTPNKEDVADLMLRSGYAWYHNDTVNEIRYRQAERYAQEDVVGIWSQPDRIAPWEWRKHPRIGNEK